MCKQRAALNIIKGQKNRGGLGKAALLLHEEQCKDFEMMQKQIDDIKQDVCEVKHTQQEVIQKVNDIIAKIDIIGRFFNGWRFWALLLIFIASVALAGQRLIEIITKIPVQ